MPTETLADRYEYEGAISTSEAMTEYTSAAVQAASEVEPYSQPVLDAVRACD
ncbi:hypothetical protein [Asticcacaulis sp. YBE204]|uniref:hypothetical protein n=1 Tax=Asticcacaulis sp. YBE204 TaxID=1282363 RepID=UPI0003C3D0C3|nr:hypothetical protein [Asticcacaulis sp. YBE204]ESQ77393.1 hypothetical protein AEYBE204_17865 [Asticcacaulis sp. YBE204]